MIFELFGSAVLSARRTEPPQGRLEARRCPPPGTIGAAMGGDVPERVGNSARSNKEGCLVSMTVVAYRQA